MNCTERCGDSWSRVSALKRTLNGMSFDGREKDPIQKAMRDAVLAFMAPQGETNYTNQA